VTIAANSTLTITDAQRAPGVIVGGGIEHDTLFGAGALVIDPSVVYVNGVQAFTGTETVEGGSQLVVNTANAFDASAGITLGKQC